MALGAPGVVHRARNALQQRLVLAPGCCAAPRAVLVPSRAHARAAAGARPRADRGARPRRAVRRRPARSRRAADAGARGGAAPYAARGRHAAAAQEPRGRAAARSRGWTALEHRLVVVGARGWRDAGARRVPRCAGGARVGSRRPRRRRRAASRSTAAPRCSLYPSRDEGFGFPPLEAMACGTPVVAARAGEPAGGRRRRRAARGPRRRTPGWPRRWSGVLGDPAPGAARGLARAAELTWARCAELTVGVYRRAAG